MPVVRRLQQYDHSLQVAGYATQSHCTRAGGPDTTNGPITILDQCIAEQYYVRNSILRSLIYAHVGCTEFAEDAFFSLTIL